MSDMFWEDNGQAQGQESNAMKVLREKAEADSKRLNEMADQVATLTSALNAERVEKVVTSKGYDSSVVAMLTDAGLDPTPQAIEAFLTKHGDKLAKPGAAGEPNGTTDAAGGDVVPADEQAALSAMAAGAAGAVPQVGMSALESKIKGFSNADDLMKFLQSQG